MSIGNGFTDEAACRGILLGGCAALAKGGGNGSSLDCSTASFRAKPDSLPLRCIPHSRKSAGGRWKFTARFGKNRRSSGPVDLSERIRQNPSSLPQILPVPPKFVPGYPALCLDHSTSLIA
jgi:hypothetical protein